MRNDVLFLTLKVFSATGGIEKVCRIAGKAIYENAIRYNKGFRLFSMHDSPQHAVDNPYLPTEIFTGFGVRKIRFVQQAVKQGMQSRVVILSHINLLLVGWFIKKLSPNTRLVLFTHGIEVWYPFSFLKRRMLHCCDEIISVSQYTSYQVQLMHGIPAAKCAVMNNCLDPYLPLPRNVNIDDSLYKRYGFALTDKILFTLTRLAGTERYKGYDKVLEAIQQLPDNTVKYLIAGKYDAVEKKWMDELIKSLGLQGRVVLAGFVAEEQLAAHFAMAYCYVMPSRKEGFGIVFIEAMYYGLPVIAGNADGSADALLNGRLGLLVAPDDINEIEGAIEKILMNKDAYIPDRKLLMQHFSYDTYKVKVNAMLERV